MLVEDGLLVERDGALQALTEIDSLRVPGTVQAVLAARLDLLDAGGAGGAPARGRDRPGVPVGRGRRSDAARRMQRRRRPSAGARPQGADPSRPAHLRRRGWLPLRPHPRFATRRTTRCRNGSAPTARALRRLDRGSAAGRIRPRRDPRPPPRAGARATGSSSRRPAKPRLCSPPELRAGSRAPGAGRSTRGDAHAAAGLLGRAAVL